MQDNPVLEVVADHRYDRMETKRKKAYAPPLRPPQVLHRVWCKCGAHSDWSSSSSLAHDWHNVHLDRVRDGQDPL